ncbi:phage/plasmid primase, P4 family [Pseudogulbenkiania subflava]|uniref:Primase C terminal 2 (PriCT-2) n=1 Tax=Pseudogulbenkiania subflava DSM 22618 TaxID=1123014 RepID=A0A1Y6C120_9NEIS|nr:phage/plasmid primase, P4 family [Pseudogulbenkiania subflava]SMF39957.1 Primase C terminal 2 (PriCT-2) [Pseudogulbenkiania subflava DSM 22618]
MIPERIQGNEQQPDGESRHAVSVQVPTVTTPVTYLHETPLAKALRYASLGWHVLPIKPGAKVPLIGEWQNKASCDPQMVRQWWQQFPKAGIGVHCGLSGVTVIDVDPRNGGHDALAEQENERGWLPDYGCAIARTGGDGWHYVFRAHDGQRLPGKLGLGIDLLHGDRFFIVEPSTHPSGKQYRWERGFSPLDIPELPPLPDEWAAQATPVYPISHSRDLEDALSLLDPREPETPEKVEIVRSALEAISPDCGRDTYLRVLMALQSTGWDDWKQMAEEWADGSMCGQPCSLFNEQDFTRDCEGLKVDGGVSLGTLFQYAKQAGWKDPRSDVSLHDFHGDADNGHRFAEKHRGQFLFIHSDKVWLQWDGMRWAKCEQGEERAAARQVALEGLDDAQAAMKANPTDRTRDDWRQATSVFRNEKRHEALLRVASTEPGMSISNPGQLDANPLLLGVRNGVVDLRTGTLLRASPEMRISRQAGAAFNQGAQCPRWLNFLHDVFEGDEAVLGFVQRAVGYTLTGLVDEEKMFFLFGQGANGKSVFANVLHAVFGEYAVNVRSSLLTRDLRGQNSEGEREKIRLPGSRLALINEVGSHDVFDDARLKELVARDPIGARALYGESYQFMPTHKIFLRGNHQPGAMDSGDGFWRRMVLIPFKRQFAEHERIPDLERRILEAERDGILGWMVNGCIAWRRDGLGIPDSIRTASDEYRRDTDLMGEWLESCCKVRPREETPVGVLHESYCRFLREAGVNIPSRSVFGRQLANRGYQTRRSNSNRFVMGLSFDEWRDDEL